MSTLCPKHLHICYEEPLWVEGVCVCVRVQLGVRGVGVGGGHCSLTSFSSTQTTTL